MVFRFRVRVLVRDIEGESKKTRGMQSWLEVCESATALQSNKIASHEDGSQYQNLPKIISHHLFKPYPNQISILSKTNTNNRTWILHQRWFEDDGDGAVIEVWTCKTTIDDPASAHVPKTEKFRVCVSRNSSAQKRMPVF